MSKFLCSTLVGLFVVTFLAIAYPVKADVAPPEMPPGINPMPGQDSTQVRMMAEKVILDVSSIDSNATYLSSDSAQAKVTANFTMHNLGSTEEKMAVRFPLMNLQGWGDGFGKFPELTDLRVFINGVKSATQKTTTANPNASSEPGAPPISWASFNVAFPPGQDVLIDVSYSIKATGYYPYATFSYILETGAGWKDTIGSVDLIVRLPYEVNNENTLGSTAQGEPSPGALFNGKEMDWHYENLEPNAENNLKVGIVVPQAWQQVLNAQILADNSEKNGDAWGTLARACKLIILDKHGLRDDSGAKSLFQRSTDAYEKAIQFAPEKAMWHAGYAELLWANYYFMTDKSDFDVLTRIVSELKKAVTIEENNKQANDLLQEIGYYMPEALTANKSGYIYKILTATPVPTETLIGPPPGWEETLTATAQVISTATATEITEQPTNTPTEVISITQAPVEPVVQPSIQPTTQPSTKSSIPPTTVPGKQSSKLPFCCGGILPFGVVGLWKVVASKKAFSR